MSNFEINFMPNTNKNERSTFFAVHGHSFFYLIFHTNEKHVTVVEYNALFY